MKYTVEIANAIGFPFWSGAVDTIRDIQAAGKEEAFNAYMEELTADGGEWRDVDVNDYVWHERAEVYKAVGLDENGELPEIDDEPLTLTVDGREMTEEEAQQLRDALSYGADAEYVAAVGVDVDKYDGEIPNSVLNAIYNGVSFTEEDFACTCNA